MPVFRASPVKDADYLKLVLAEARRLSVVLGDTTLPASLSHATA
jgi:hypothetical protein